MSNILLTFSAIIAEIINHNDSEHQNDEYFHWTAWYLDTQITNLLSGQRYLDNPGTKKFASRIVGYHMSSHKDLGHSAQQYMDAVISREIQLKRSAPDDETPCDRLQDFIRANCLDKEKQQETNLKPTSLWDIFERAGKHDSENVNTTQVYYRFWRGDSAWTLKNRLSAVLSSANRHYGEIYRLGLYPPDFIDHINTSQIRKLNKLVGEAKILAESRQANWRQVFPEVWDQSPIKKIGDDKIADYKAFTEHDVGKCLLGTARANVKLLSYDELSEDDTDYHLMAELAGVDLETEFFIDLQRIIERLNDANVDTHNRELLFNIVHQRDIDSLIEYGTDEDALFARLREELKALLQDKE